MSQVLSTTNHRSEADWPTAEAWSKPCLCIGHGGAAGHAPSNTLRSLTLALEMGVDVVEFDVRPCRDALVLLHDDSLAQFGDAQGLASQSTLEELQALPTGPDRQIPTLEQALDLLKGRALVNIDLKATGYEQAVVELVRARGMAGDVLYSSLYPDSLRRVRQVEPRSITGLSYPEDRGNSSSKPYLQPVVSVVVGLMRLALPHRILRMMVDAEANAVMLYHRVVSRSTVMTVHRAGGKVFTWTVDAPQRMRQLRDLGVDGITSNYPDLFAGLG